MKIYLEDIHKGTLEDIHKDILEDIEGGGVKKLISISKSYLFQPRLLQYREVSILPQNHG